MALVTTPAILLRSHPYSESSRVLRFYTRDLGLVGVMARGVRRGASKGRGAPGTFGEGTAVILVHETRELQSLREFAPRKARIGLAAHLQRLAGASLAAELVLRHAGQEPHVALYDLLSQGLDRLESAPSSGLATEALALGWSIVDVFGFGPELSACTGCGRPLDADEMARFDLDAGGVRCSMCEAPAGSRRIGPVARAQLARFLEGDARPLAAPRHGTSAAPSPAPPTALPDAPSHASQTALPGAPAHLALLDDFVTCHLLEGRRPDSFRFLRSADPAPPTGRSSAAGHRGRPADRPASTDHPAATDRPASDHRRASAPS